MNGETKERILATLAEHPRGLTISDIADRLDIHRATAAKYLEVLRVEDRVEQRVVGQAKLHYPAQQDVEVAAE